jgi:hypothetical protein
LNSLRQNYSTFNTKPPQCTITHQGPSIVPRVQWEAAVV